MNYSRGDLVDRYAIELRKSVFGGVQNAELLGKLADEIRAHQWSAEDLLLAVQIGISNDAIAALEWQIREDDGRLSDAEIGVRARETRKVNDWRGAARRAIDGLPPTFSPAFRFPLNMINLDVQRAIEARAAEAVGGACPASSAHHPKPATLVDVLQAGTYTAPRWEQK